MLDVRIILEAKNIHSYKNNIKGYTIKNYKEFIEIEQNKGINILKL